MRTSQAEIARRHKSKRKAAYQAEYRAKQRALKRPDFQVISETLFHHLVSQILKAENWKALNSLADATIRELSKRGYDPIQCEKAFDAITDRIEDGWTLNRKIRPTPPPEIKALLDGPPPVTS
ncbi:hypothetical protein [Roseibium aestuarii]|uniref:Uncharacterized protein n=1 Tax=Roseibium aestuarii TaxID=2600299 RepID=A0ABW4JT41_9HYPH|nr:hypothetical protein [Roseibium aestuarii]